MANKAALGISGRKEGMNAQPTSTNIRFLSWEEAAPRAKDRWEKGDKRMNPGDLLSIEMCPKCRHKTECVWPSLACPIKRLLADEKKEKAERKASQEKMEALEVRQIERLDRKFRKTREALG